MRAASVYYKGMFNCDNFLLPQQVIMKRNIIGETDFHNELKSFMSDADMVVPEITVANQVYKNGDLLVLEMNDVNLLKAGSVQSILVKNNKVYFVCKVYSCMRSWLQFFESQSCDDHCSFVECKSILDYKPLIMRGTADKLYFVLHHRVCFDYK